MGLAEPVMQTSDCRPTGPRAHRTPNLDGLRSHRPWPCFRAG